MASELERFKQQLARWAMAHIDVAQAHATASLQSAEEISAAETVDKEGIAALMRATNNMAIKRGMAEAFTMLIKKLGDDEQAEWLQRVEYEVTPVYVLDTEGPAGFTR